MPSPYLYHLLANLVLLSHVAIVMFVVFGLMLVYLGFFFHWSWVRNFWFRLVHVLSILIVAVQSWLGIVCPLTTLEMFLRAKAGMETYSGSFIQHWLQYLLYYDAPAWAFVIVYTLFAALVMLSWFIVKPNSLRQAN